jgi:F0F1-type ATP synthase epsilon subunit
MRIKISSPEKNLYEGDGISIYVTTEMGDAEILEKHAEFLAIIKGKIKIREANQKSHEIDLNDRKALLYTDGKRVDIFIV